MGKALIDANVLVGLARKSDALHESAVKLIESVKNKCEIWVLNLVVQEAATVVSMRDGMTASRLFYENYRDLVEVEISLDEELETDGWKIFLAQNKKGTSFVDCANLAVIEKYKLDGILTFDEFYPEKMRVGAEK